MHELQLRQWVSAHRLACLDTLWSINHARQHAPFSPQFAAAAMPGAAPPAPLERHARRSALVAGAAALQVGRRSRISLQALCSSPCKLILLLACCPVPCSQDDLRKQLRGHHNRPQQLRRLLHNLRVRPILQTQPKLAAMTPAPLTTPLQLARLAPAPWEPAPQVGYRCSCADGGSWGGSMAKRALKALPSPAGEP